MKWNPLVMILQKRAEILIRDSSAGGFQPAVFFPAADLPGSDVEHRRHFIDRESDVAELMAA